VLFAAEPNFRAFSDGTAKLLLNAIMGPNPKNVSARALAAPSPQAATPWYESPIRVSVKTADAAKAADVLRSLGAKWTETRSGGVVHYVIDNPSGLSADHHPFAGRIPSLIRKAGITPIAVVLP